jgi:hypothetical protein
MLVGLQVDWQQVFERGRTAGSTLGDPELLAAQEGSLARSFFMKNN